MYARRIAWTMLAVSIYLGLFTAGVGPLAPAETAQPIAASAPSADSCVTVGTDGRVTVNPEDCATPPAP